MEERRFRVASLFEWIAAAAGVAALVWLLSVPVQRLIGPRVDAALVEVSASLPPGVPPGATSVPAIMLLDGREIRAGDSATRVAPMLPERLAAGPAQISAGEFGDRRARGYTVDGVRFYVVTERWERGGPVRVSALYLP